MAKHRFMSLERVTIEGVETVLQHRVEGEGGWRVEPAVQDCRYWNECEMTPETEGDKLVRRLYESDEANALTNEAARFIERQLKNDR